MGQRHGIRRATVLVADDEPAIRRLVRTAIETDEYRVVEAADGDEAWAALSERRPGAAILDVRMAGRNGLELARAVKADPDLSRTRVILLSCMAQGVDVAAGQAAGADYYLAKPFSPLQLLRTVDEAVRAHYRAAGAARPVLFRPVF